MIKKTADSLLCPLHSIQFSPLVFLPLWLLSVFLLIIFRLTLYFKCLKALKDYDVSTSILSDVLLNHILGMAKLSGLGFVVISFAWGPFALLCAYSLLAGAKDLNIYMTMIPPIMAKVRLIQNCTYILSESTIAVLYIHHEKYFLLFSSFLVCPTYEQYCCHFYNASNFGCISLVEE